YIKAQGTVDAVQRAFHVQIHNYNFNGRAHRSNKDDPSVDNPAGGNIAAISGLDDLGFQPQFVRTDPDANPLPARPLRQLRPAGAFFEGLLVFPGPEMHTFAGGGNTAIYSGNRYGAPISVGGVLTLGNPD